MEEVSQLGREAFREYQENIRKISNGKAKVVEESTKSKTSSYSLLLKSRGEISVLEEQQSKSEGVHQTLSSLGRRL